MAKDRITLTRKAALLKLAACTRAVYFIQVDGGHVYKKEEPVADMVHAFERDQRARLRIRLSDSQHTVTISESRELRTGYEVEF